MQTFLPYLSFVMDATCLDNKRLNKQIVEAWQILTDKVPNLNHPACLMWKDCKWYLQEYALACCSEYNARFEKRHGLTDAIADMTFFSKIHPSWCLSPVLHISHRVNLLRKDPVHYDSLRQFLPSLDLSTYPTGYYWPVEPVGKKAKEDRAAWIAWAKKNGVEA